jgi:hypothetical protein
MREPASPELLADVVGRMLETAAFIFSELCSTPPPCSGPALQAAIAIESPEGEVYELTLSSSAGLALSLAANLLGVDPGDPEADGCAADAVGELANITAGVLATELHGAVAICRLGLPRVQSTAALTLAEPPRGCRITMVTEDGERLDAALAPRCA